MGNFCRNNDECAAYKYNDKIIENMFCESLKIIIVILLMLKILRIL